MSLAVASRAYCPHKPNTHNNGKIVGKRVGAPSRIAAVRAAPMLLHENQSLSAVNYNLIMEVETMGGAPKPPSPVNLGGTEWPAEGCIKFGVAKTPLDPVLNAEYCDPVFNSPRSTFYSSSR